MNSIAQRTNKKQPHLHDWQLLLPFIDPTDWGYRGRTGIMRAVTNDQLQRLRNRQFTRVQRMSKELIESHMRGTDQIHYAPDRRGEVMLICADIDAHDGQTDVPEAIQLVTAIWGDGYYEASPRGAHVYHPLRVERIPRKIVNEALIRFEQAVRAVAADEGIESTIEIIPTFTTWTATGEPVRGRLAALPRPCTPTELHRLTSMEPLPLSYLDEWASKYQTISLPTSIENTIRGSAAVSSAGDAFARMVEARIDFNRRFGRDPEGVDEITDHYQVMYPEHGPTHRARAARASWVLRKSLFDPAKRTGFAGRRRELLELAAAIPSQCRRLSSYPSPLTDIDLAVGLWVVEKASFEIAPKPVQQFGVPNKRIQAAIQSLAEAGEIDRDCGSSPKKATAIKRALEAAGLIQCIDAGYRFGTNGHGCARKFVVGPNHPWRSRWEDWLREHKPAIRLIDGHMTVT